MEPNVSRFSRRQFMNYFSGLGLGGTLLPGVLWGQLAAAQSSEVTTADLAAAEKLAGLVFTGDERELILRGINRLQGHYDTLREVPLENATTPALFFDPRLPGRTYGADTQQPWPQLTGDAPRVPRDLNELAFWSVADLARAIRTRKISCGDLTEIYLERLKRYGATLQAVVTLTEERAREQARERDRELAAGTYRGPLHGIPWGAKDLLAVKGYPTTWGAMPYKGQTFDYDATVIQRLDDAGAVLVAKLTLGALAMGDVWFGGRTNNPWNVEQGSSGSSAGPAAATAAGLVAFAIGSETNGSIVSPCTRCGVTGLRPTFGRVSRHGAMALAWSLDKLGPIARTAEDCALVFDAIRGPDGADQTVVDYPFNWNPARALSHIRVGVPDNFDDNSEDRAQFEDVLRTLKRIGVEPKQVTLPEMTGGAMMIILEAEAATAFDDLTRGNDDDLLVRQDAGAWPTTFRRSRFIPAVEYLRANRVRTKLMEATARVFEEVDVIIQPTYHRLYEGNLTGQPLAVLPSGFSDRRAPQSFSILGGLYREAEVLRIAHAFQSATDFHKRRPPLNATD